MLGRLIWVGEFPFQGEREKERRKEEVGGEERGVPLGCKVNKKKKSKILFLKKIKHNNKMNF